MRFLSHRREQEQTSTLASNINMLFDNVPMLKDNNFGRIAYDTESMKSEDEGGISYSNQVEGAELIQKQLENAGLRAHLEATLKLEKMPEGPEKAHAFEKIEAGMEAAVATAVALIDADNYQRAYLSATPKPTEGTITLMPSVPTQASNYSLDMEGFDNFKFDTFRATAIISNALNAMTSSFEDAFFKPVLISPAEQGVDVTIRIPYVYNNKIRSANGGEYETSHKLVIDAYRDRSILSNSGNSVVPNVAVVDSSFIASASDVPNKAVTLNGQVVETRPLVFGKTVDLLAASAHPGLSGSSTQDETDTLSPTASLGKLYVKLTDSETVPNVKVAVVDTTPLTGSLFLPSQVGDTQQLMLHMDTIANIKSTTLTADDGVAVSVTGINVALGQAPTDDWTLAVRVKLAGQFWPRRGNIEVNTQSATPIEVVGAFNKDGDPATDAQVTAIKAALTLELNSYFPKVRRTNSNLRDKGMGVDLGSTIKYRLAVPILSPITSTMPHGVEGGGIGMDGLQMMRRAVNNNISVQTLFDYEEVIRSCNGQKTQHAGIGSHLVTPTLVEDTVDIKQRTTFIRSKGNRDDVRDALGAAIDQVASELLEKSGYLATLEALYGTTTGFEFVVGCSPRIHSLLMTSGDARLMGSNRRFTIVSNHDDDLIDKIYITVRRPGVASVDALSFGAHVTVAPLIYTAPATMRNGANQVETQLLPRELYVGTCPVLGKLTVNGLDRLFTDN